MSGSAIAEFVRESSFIFAGTVTSVGQSSLSVLPARAGLAVVRFDRGFLVNPVLGNLAGRPITVRLAQAAAGASAVRPGQQLVFFTAAWVHGTEIAVGELGRLSANADTEEEVARAVAALPEREGAVFVLCYFQNLELPEIARCLGISYSAAGAALSRARAKLAHSFAESTPEKE